MDFKEARVTCLSVQHVLHPGFKYLAHWGVFSAKNLIHNDTAAGLRKGNNVNLVRFSFFISVYVLSTKGSASHSRRVQG